MYHVTIKEHAFELLGTISKSIIRTNYARFKNPCQRFSAFRGLEPKKGYFYRDKKMSQVLRKAVSSQEKKIEIKIE